MPGGFVAASVRSPSGTKDSVGLWRPGPDDPHARPEFQPADVLWLLSVLAACHRLDVDAALLARECLPPLRFADIERLAGRVGLRVQPGYSAPSLPASLKDYPLPVALQLRAASGEGVDAVEPLPGEWCVLVGFDGTHAEAVFRDGSGARRLPFASLAGRLTGQLIELLPPDQAQADPDGAGEGRGTFGFAWFIPELLRYRAIWVEVIVASFVMQLLALGVPLFTQVIIDKVIVHRTGTTLLALGIAMALCLVFSALLGWIRQYLVLHAGRRVDAVLGSRVFEHLCSLPLDYFRERQTGVIASRLQGIEAIREFISSAGVMLILDLPFLGIFIALMFWYSSGLALLVLGVLAAVVMTSVVVAPLFQTRLNEQFLRGASVQAFVTEHVAGMETVKSLQLEPQLQHRFRSLLAALLDASFRTRQLANAYQTSAAALEQLMMLLILVVGAYIVMTTAALTIGMLVAFQMFAARVSQPMLRLVGLWQQLQQARLAARRLGDIMDAPPERHHFGRARTGNGPAAIGIENLSFRHGEGLPLLFDDFSLDIAPGELVAVTGPSGAGKSTLAGLLQGFHRPVGGTLRIDGIDIRHLAANELRSGLGVVPQDTVLFSGTLFDNLQIASPFATFEQIVAACRLAGIAPHIESLPDGYRTRTGERGVGLSGGQRQRLAIARALLRSPRILLFDEATASLDPATATGLARTINGLKRHATILFIAHALPSALDVDRIVRVGGQEQGT